MSSRRVGELMEQRTIIWSSVIFKGPFKICDHEFKVKLVFLCDFSLAIFRCTLNIKEEVEFIYIKGKRRAGEFR